MTITSMLAPFSAEQAAACFAIVFFTAIMRGYTGFGFALISIPLLTMVIDPVVAVPTVLMLEVLGSLQLLPKLWRSAHLGSVGWLLIGAAVATPVGVYGLATLPADLMRLIIAIVVLLTTLGLATGFRLEGRPGVPAVLATGVVSGLLNGGAAMSGPPVILFYLGTGAAAQVGRASSMLYFFLSDSIAVGFAALSGLVQGPILSLTALMVPALVLGQVIGARLFASSLNAHYRAVAIIVLLAVSSAALIQSAHSVWAIP